MPNTAFELLLTSIDDIARATLWGRRESPTLEDVLARTMAIRKQYNAERTSGINSPSSLPPEHPCPECANARRLAYSGATTPGFFAAKCSHHSCGRLLLHQNPDPIRPFYVNVVRAGGYAIAADPATIRNSAFAIALDDAELAVDLAHMLNQAYQSGIASTK